MDIIQDYSPRVRSNRFRGNTARIKDFFRFIAEEIKKRRERKRNLREMWRLDDHLLSDIGLSRVDVDRITSDPRFRDESLRRRWIDFAGRRDSEYGRGPAFRREES